MEKRIKIRIGALAVLGILLSMVCIPAIYMAQTWGSDHTSDTSYRVIIDDDDNANDEVFAVWHDGDENDNPPGEELFRIQENGRVGIGTTNPGVTLHVRTYQADRHIRIERENQYPYPEGTYMDLISGGAFCALDCVSTYDEVFQIQEDGVARFHITKGGNTGIGTTSPQNRLDVEGSVAIGASYSGSSLAPSNGLIVEGNVGIGTTGPVTTLDVNGGLATNIITVFQLSYIVPPQNTDFTILVDTIAAGGPVTIILPPAALVDGQIIVVKKIDLGGFPVTVVPVLPETIDGAPNLFIARQWDSYMIQANDNYIYGPNWYIISNF